MSDDEAARKVETGVVDLDPILHAPARLKIAMVLAALGTVSFHTLAKEAELTAGNLASHLKQLEQAGYVESRRHLIDLKPRMRYALTDAGADALRTYCRRLAVLLRGIEEVVDAGAPPVAGPARDPADAA